MTIPREYLALTLAEQLLAPYGPAPAAGPVPLELLVQALERLSEAVARRDAHRAASDREWLAVQVSKLTTEVPHADR